MRTSRREFVKGAAASGIALSLSRLALAEEPGFAARETLPSLGQMIRDQTGLGDAESTADAVRRFRDQL